MHDGIKISKPVHVRLFDEIEEAHREAGWLPTWLLDHPASDQLDAYRRVILDAVAVGIGRSGRGETPTRELDAAGMVALLAIDALGTTENRPFIEALIAVVDAAKAFADGDTEGFRAHLDSFASHKAVLDARAEPRLLKARAQMEAFEAGKEAAPEVVAASA